MIKTSKIIKNLAFVFAVAVSSLILTYAVSAVWSEPGATPPAGNVDAPLNVGSTTQTKGGSLILNADGVIAAGLTVNKNALFLNGNVGIGTITPTSKLEVAGEAAQPGAAQVRSIVNSYIITTTGGAFADLVAGSQITALRSFNDTRIVVSNPVDPFNQVQVDQPVDWSAGYDFSYIKNPQGIKTSGALTTTGLVSFEGAYEGTGGIFVKNMDITLGGGNDSMFSFRHIDIVPHGPGQNNVIIFENQRSELTMAIDTENKRVGIGEVHPQGALDISSTAGALIVPRMTTAQITALAATGSAVNGSIVYDITTNQFKFRENGAWVLK